ncbi:MAG TPA: cupin domain-containing protein, partial [Rubrobacter sp.]|nr:cupin domain-containing protein [Rubrobacter sp.]
RTSSTTNYLGAPLKVLMLYPDGTGAVSIVGPDLAAGERPQLFVPGGAFHTSRPAKVTPCCQARSGRMWSRPTSSMVTSKS